jgi:tetratricopeptide (TPR) repeat protein
VDLQNSGKVKEAAAHFELASRLNPKNIVARINLEYNQRLRTNQSTSLELSKTAEDQADEYRDWNQVLRDDGPYSEPGLCYTEGYRFLKDGLLRQAARCFDRARRLSPSDAASRMWLAQLNLAFQLPNKALELIHEIRDHPERFSLSRTNRDELLALEARAQYALREPRRAEHILETALEQSPNDEYLLNIAARIYSQNGQYSNALAIINQHLTIAPNNPTLLLNKGVLCIQINDFKEAIQPLTRAMALQTNNYQAQFSRAIAYLRNDQLDAAQKDYQYLQGVFPKKYQVYYGLGEIAYRRKDTNAAIRYYESYLTNAVPSRTNAAPSPKEIEFVANRIAELKGASH